LVIKDKFELLNQIPNLLNVPQSSLKSYEHEENTPSHIFTSLTLRQRHIKHFTKDKIFKLIANKKEREIFQVVNFEKYPLAVTINKPTKKIVINLKPYDVEIIDDLNPNDLFANVVYGYGFFMLATGKTKIGDLYAKPIVDFMTSMLVRTYGKQYGLTEIYSSGIPRLKFLLSCYVFSSFFGVSHGNELLRKAGAVAPYNYQPEAMEILKYDYTSTIQFLKALSDLKVMPGIKGYSFTAKLLQWYGINMIAGFEDLSRFMCAIIAASIRGSTMVPTWISKYHEKAFNQILEIAKKVYR